jgi:hypothetical protein
MPSRSVKRRCCMRTLSVIVTPGNRPRSCGGPALLGDEEAPLPNRFGMIMKYPQIGRRWDTVYSEIREQIDPNSVTQLHILGHVFSTPARLIVGIPRTPVIPRGWVVRGRISPSRISCGRWGRWSIVIANIRWCWGGWGGACRETNQQSRDQDFFDHFPSSLFIAEGGRHR